MKCRSCRNEIKGSVIEGYLYVAELFGEVDEPIIDNEYCSDACQKNQHFRCKSEFECGHKCIAHSNHICEKVCTEPGCSRCTTAQTCDTDCVFCSEQLSTEPCVFLDCGHIFHLDCLTKMVEMRWEATGPMNLSFLDCPYCKARISYKVLSSYNDKLYRTIQDSKNLIGHLKHLVQAQMKAEGLNIYEDCVNDGLKRYNFFECNKCKSVYCGGKRDCARLVDAKMDPAEMICAGCRGCAKHGTDFMMFKCRFCCKLSNWFCFGTTHFCEGCHNNAGDFWNGHSRKELPACVGKGICPVAAMGVLYHPPNGEEYAFCIACKEVDHLERTKYLTRQAVIPDEEDSSGVHGLFEDIIAEIERAERLKRERAAEKKRLKREVRDFFRFMRPDVFAERILPERRVVPPLARNDGIFDDLFGGDGLGGLFAAEDDEVFGIGELFDGYDNDEDKEEDGEAESSDVEDEEEMYIGSLFEDFVPTTPSTSSESPFFNKLNSVVHQYGSWLFTVGIAVLLNNVCVKLVV